MTFLIRHEVVANQYCSFYVSSSESFPIAAGTVVKLVGETTDGRAIVDVVTDAQNDVAFGFLMQKVREESSENPPGFRYRSDLGSSDCFKGDPCGVAHGPGAIYETDQYVDNGGDGIAVGTLLYVDDDGKLEDTQADTGTLVGIAISGLSIAEAAAGKLLRFKSLI
jgi:hypothetical protein